VTALLDCNAISSVESALSWQ